MCHFSLEEDVLHVMKGLWTLRSHPIVLQRWTEGIVSFRVTDGPILDPVGPVYCYSLVHL